MTLEEARQHCFFMDSRGLINASRPDAVAGTLAAHKVRVSAPSACLVYRPCGRMLEQKDYTAIQQAHHLCKVAAVVAQ